ncbi:MAG: hypothetical protein HFACDABA_03242 [Anaerolineales bacterium]|nr:hypothetical protein [Anaerolineales bacterium]
MRTVRRLYFYLVAFITFEVVLWGVIGLLRSILSPSLGGSGSLLAGSLALILVGVPIFFLHWAWAQRASANNPEEQVSTLRAFFLYGALLATLIPVAQNILALINRTLIEATGFDSFRAAIGGGQTWTDNLIAVALNGIAAWYFVTVLRADWKRLPDTENFADIRRLYRTIWMLYGLLMSVFGVQQILRFILYIPSETLGIVNRDVFINGLSLLIVGLPIWVVAWRTCQTANDEPGERDSNLRLGVLYLLAFSGVAVVLSTAGILLDMILRWALGETFVLREFVREISGEISIGVPFGIVWAYFSRWLNRDIESIQDSPRRDGLRRFYHYALSLAGLVTAFLGVGFLLAFILDVSVGRQLWGEDLRSRVASALATLIIGLPLWYLNWKPMQLQALSSNMVGGLARRSLVRKVYLYLVLFGSVIGGMVTAVMVVYLLLQVLLGVDTFDVSGLLDRLQWLIMFVVVLAYHFTSLRRDGAEAARALAEEREGFKTLVFEEAGSGFGEQVRSAMAKQAEGLSASVIATGENVPAEATSAKAVILPSSVMSHLPDALRNFLNTFGGQVIVVPVAQEKWLWLNNDRKSVEQAAHAVRQLSDGQEVKFGGTSAFMVMVYVFAALFGLELLFILLSIGISLIVD